MTEKQKNNVRVYSSDYEYSPVLVITDAGKVIVKGDNVHDSGYEMAAEGAAIAFGSMGVETRVVNITYDYSCPKWNELSAEHEAFLIEHGQESFLKEAKDC